MYWFNERRWRWLHVLFAKWRVALVVLGLVPYLYLAQGGSLWAGLACLVPGELLQLWAAANLNKNEALADTGPYAWVRNPMYIGRLLVGVGLTLMVSVWWLLLPIFVMIYVLYVHARVLREEERLHSYLGDAYIEYCRRVGRWMPRVIPKLRQSLSWSWESVRRNHQLRVTAALALVVLMVIARRQLL